MSVSPEKVKETVESNIDEIRLLQFSVFEKNGREIQFGLNTHKIREVVEWESLSPLPETLKPLIGVYDLRGIPVPVIDVSMKLVNCPTVHSDRPQPRILICEIMKRLIGLLVQKTSQISLHNNQDILPTPIDLTGAPNAFINGIIRGDSGGFTYMMDIEALLATITSAEETSQSSSLSPLHGTHVLIVEDSKIFQKRAVQYFTDLHCTFDIVGDGAQGLEKLKKNIGKDYDVVFTDIEMPLMNGIEMALAIKADEKLRHIPIVFNSSISNPALIEEIKQRGLGQYVVKFDPQLIANAIRSVINLSK